MLTGPWVGDHFVVKLYCTPESWVMLCTNFTSINNTLAVNKATNSNILESLNDICPSSNLIRSHESLSTLVNIHGF